MGDTGSLDLDGSGLQLGDISFDAAIGKTFDSRRVLFAGVIGTLPTATDERVDLNQYLLGPEFFIGRGAKWVFVGVLGKTPWKFNLQYWYYLESPEIFGPKHQVRFQITPVIPLPW